MFNDNVLLQDISMQSRELRRIAKKKPETEVERKRGSHPWLYAFSVVLLIVIVVTFVGSPLASRLGGGRRIIFGSYAGKDIEYIPGNYFAKQTDIIADELRQDDSSDSFEVQAYTVWRQAFEQTVSHTAILYECERSGIWISENLVDETIIEYGPYMDNGVFSEERYRDASNAEKTATRKYFREQLLHSKYLQDLVAFQKTSQKEIQFFESMATPERSFQFVNFLYSDYPQEEILLYGQANKEKFQKIKLSRILVKSNENEALEIKKKLLEQSSSFEELAKALSKDSFAEKGGDMGWRYYYDLEGDFEDTESLLEVFQLTEGELSDVIEGKFGWMIFRCDAETIEAQFIDEESFELVEEYMMRYERGRVEDYFWAKAESLKQSTEQKGFLDATRDMNLSTAETSFFPINFRNLFYYKPVQSTSESVDIASAIYNEDFFVKAFTMKSEESESEAVSEPITLDDQIIVLKLKSERDPPEEDIELLKTYFQYVADQTLQLDLQSAIVNTDKLEDNFQEVFSRYFTPRS